METKPLTEMTLWELEAELHDLDSALLAAAEGPLPEAGGEAGPDPLAAWDEAQATLATRTEELCSAFTAKVGGWAKLYWMRRRRAEEAKAEADRLQEIYRVNTNMAERVKRTLMGVMDRLGLERFDAATFRLTVAKNGGNPTVTWDEATPVPLALAKPAAVDPARLWEVLEGLGAIDAFARLVDVRDLKPDPAAVLAATRQDGVVPPGFTVERGRHLRIR